MLRLGSRARLAAVTLLLATLVGPFGSLHGSAAVAAPKRPAVACAAERDDERAAAATAVACGRRVEVLQRRSEVRQEFANPDGSTTAQLSSSPVRVRTADGGWRTVDTRLGRAPDGALEPGATVRRMRLSGGGDTALATVDTPAGPLAVSWPSALPAPVLDGDAAVYPEVLPGVDLRVRALAEGFTFVLVVRTRAAAANQALREIRFGLSTSGGSVVAQDGGTFGVRNAGGELAGEFGAPAMWDSSGTGTTADEPGDGAHTATPQMSVSGTELVLRPDRALLDDPHATLPIYVDPPFQSPWNIWAYANSNNNTHPMDVARVGNDPDGAGIFRTFWRFPAWDLAGSTIITASFFAKVVHSWSCAATPIDLYVVDDVPNHGKVPWSPPLRGAPLSERWVNAHKGSGACGNQPDAWVEFSDYFTNHVQSAASAGASWINVGVSTQRWNWSTNTPYGESDTSLWKKLDPANVYMTATYNRTPNAPTAQPLGDCYKACTSPAATRSLQPQLASIVSDPDGGTLRAEFEIWNQASTTRVQASGTAVTGVASGSVALWRPPVALTADSQYTWRVRGCDAYVCGPWLAWQALRTDSTRPAVPATSSTLYQEDTTGTVNGGIGVPGTFTFGAGGSPDVVEYSWSLDDSSPITVAAPAAGQPVTVTITPLRDLLAVLRVTSRDAAGNVSDPRVYRFRVTPPPAETAGWWLNEASGDVAHDHIDGRPATRVGPVVWGAPGRHADDSAARFSGNGSFQTSLPVLSTTNSFSVAAWVRLTDTTGYRVIASQDGSVVSMFQLQYRPVENRFCIAMRAADATTAAQTFACAPTPPQLNTWVHLAAVHDATRHTITLYVNGGDPERGGSVTEVPFTSAWDAVGAFAIGRNRSGGAAGGWFVGDIDEVLAFPRALPLEEVQFLSFN